MLLAEDCDWLHGWLLHISLYSHGTSAQLYAACYDGRKHWVSPCEVF